MSRLPIVALSLVALLLAGCGQESAADSPARWPKSVQKEMAIVPVLSEGRIKPFDTWASFALLRMNNMRTCKDADGVRLNHLEWALDALFRPGWARQHRCFLITTDEVLDAINLEIGGRKKRDRYSFEELRPALDRLSEIAPQYLEKKPQDRSPVEEGLVRLLLDVHDFASMLQYMDFARSSFRVEGSEALMADVGGKTQLAYSDVIKVGPKLFARFKELVPGDDATPDTLEGDARAINDLLGTALKISKERRVMRIFPPTVGVEEESTWYTLEHLGEMGLVLGGIDERHRSMLVDLEAISAAATTPEDALEPLQSFRETSEELAGARSEYDQIEREVLLYKINPFNNSGYLALLAFLAVALSWLFKTGSKAKRVALRTAWVLMVASLALLTLGIVMRCIIRGRPPVTGLYDTIIFITWVTVLSCLLIEWITKKKLAFYLAPIVGVLGMFIAASYEVVNRGDTMPRLQAVLDTNFWLTLHVLCISIGYAAALLAGFLGHLYVLRRFFQGRNAGRNYGAAASMGWTILVAVLTFAAFNYFGSLWLGILMALIVAVVMHLHWRQDLLPSKKVNEAYYRDLGRLVYGVTCFALLFSLVGTILGGVWANESWGRFWGWDPKENGALLICLCQLGMLHARMAGLIKAFGMSVVAIFGGMVTAFSWWGVNLLGIGLHSYGFTSGIWSALMLFYAVELLVLGAAFHAWLRDRKPDPTVQSVRPAGLPAEGTAPIE